MRPSEKPGVNSPFSWLSFITLARIGAMTAEKVL